MKFLPDVCQYVYWVLAEIWAPYSSYKIGNKFFNDHCEGWKEDLFVFETVWFSAWVNTHSFNLKFFAFCPKFSWDSYVKFQEKTISGEFFRIFVQTKAILQKLWNFALLYAILFWIRITLTKIHTSTFICCSGPGKEARPKINHKKKIRGRKTRTFCFRKTSFVHSWSGTYYALLLGCFGMKFLPDVRLCVDWVLAEIWAPDSSHKIENKILFVTARDERKVCLCVKLFDYFVGEYSSVCP